MARVERRHLEAFQATAESGSIAAAAQRLNASPSTVSKAVTSLEGILGQQLFRRTPAGAVVTAPAQKLLNPTARALAILTALDDRSHTGTLEIAGHDDLHVVTVMTLVPDPMSQVVGEHLRRHRGRKVFVEGLRQPELDAVVDLVATGQFDAGITETPRVLPTEISGVPLEGTEFYGVLPPGSTLERPGFVTPGDLLRAGLVVGPYWESSTMRRSLVSAEPRLRGAVAVRTGHRSHFLRFVRAGMGAAMMRGELALRARAAGCVVGAVEDLEPTSLSVLYRSDHLNTGLRDFVQVCADYRAPVLDL